MRTKLMRGLVVDVVASYGLADGSQVYRGQVLWVGFRFCYGCHGDLQKGDLVSMVDRKMGFQQIYHFACLPVRYWSWRRAVGVEVKG